MLVLTRKSGQSIQIGNDIVVTVLVSDNGQVRLGFEAPADIPILRTELLDRQIPAAQASLKTPLNVAARG